MQIPETQIKLNNGQIQAMDQIAQFLNSPNDDIFILRGSAGTGKTTLIGHLLALLARQKINATVLAPTGRAARIVAHKTGGNASTIHGAIYDFTKMDIFEQAESSNDPGFCLHFSLNQDEPTSGVYIVDEASMVGDRESQSDTMRFGSGRLLTDLIQHLRQRRQGREADVSVKIIFVGDPAQLPPVNEDLSPALSASYLKDQHDLA
ncbi:MAG: AAA family ATPase, partial [Pseudomonadota bacterium]